MAHRTLLALVLALALSGCGTLFDTLGDEKPSRTNSYNTGGQVRIYGGVRWDVEYITDKENLGWILAVLVLDLPLSAVLDTVLLPVTITYNLVTD